MSLEALLAFWLQFHYLKYVALAPISLIEGPIISMAGGLFVRLGYLDPVAAWLFLAAGEIVGDIVWYVIGWRWGGRFVARFGPWFGLEASSIETAKALFVRYHTPILFFTKVTMGLGLSIPVLFTAGLTRIRFSWFMFLSVTGQLIWTALLMFAGYYLGEAYLQINSVFGRVTLIIMVAAAGVGIFLLVRQLRTKLLERSR